MSALAASGGGECVVAELAEVVVRAAAELRAIERQARLWSIRLATSSSRCGRVSCGGQRIRRLRRVPSAAARVVGGRGGRPVMGGSCWRSSSPVCRLLRDRAAATEPAGARAPLGAGRRRADRLRRERSYDQRLKFDTSPDSWDARSQGVRSRTERDPARLGEGKIDGSSCVA